MFSRWSCLLLGLPLILAGCNDRYPESLEYTFSPYPEVKDEGGQKIQVFFDIPADQQNGIKDQLKEYFGTPAHPKVQVGGSVQTDPQMQLSEERLEQGAILYRRLCLHCHGINGDGLGPTGQFLNPRPRDFRQGWFKFRSTVNTSNTGALTAPSREDIKRTIRNGMPAASMPSFSLLSEPELDDLTSYVIHLSLRGQVEYQLAKGAEDAEAEVNAAAKKWLQGAKMAFTPPPAAKSWEELHQEGVETNWARARKLYAEGGGCLKCHGQDGRGSEIEVSTYRDKWGYLNQPRNLTHGIYRGGSRPTDIFNRIKIGVAGTEMPAASLADEDIWYLVDFVLSLPQLQGR